METLEPVKKFGRKEAFYSLALAPLEYMTKSLRQGDAWALDELDPFVRRCRALVSAYDDRIKVAQKTTEN